MSAKICNFAYDNGIYNSMKKWQKIVGIVAIIVLAYAHLAILQNYLEIMDFSGAWHSNIEQEWFVYYIDKNIKHFWAYHILSFIDWVIIICLFICLWKKGGRK